MCYLFTLESYYNLSRIKDRRTQMDWGKVFGNLLTLTVALTAIIIMIALAVHAVRNITRNLNETKKRNDKDL